MRRLTALAISLGCTLAATTARAQQQPVDAEPDREQVTDGFGEWYLAGAITAASASIAMGALGIWATLEIDALDEDARFRRFAEGVPPSVRPCEAAELGLANKDYRLLPGAMFPSEAMAHCADRKEMVAIQLVTLPSAVVFSGLAAFLFAEAFGEGPDDLQLATQVGPSSFGVTAAARF